MRSVLVEEVGVISKLAFEAFNSLLEYFSCVKRTLSFDFHNNSSCEFDNMFACIGVSNMKITNQ